MERSNAYCNTNTAFFEMLHYSPFENQVTLTRKSGLEEFGFINCFLRDKLGLGSNEHNKRAWQVEKSIR